MTQLAGLVDQAFPFLEGELRFWPDVSNCAVRVTSCVACPG